MNAESILSALKTERFGQRLHWYPETDSTNNRAKELAMGGASEGTLVVADAQTAGRGRLGRIWDSEAGTSLLFSVVMTPELSPIMAGIVPIAAAVAVARGISTSTGLRSECKWPNDLLLRRKKICGILTESVMEGSSLRALIVGVGVNVNQTSFPPDLANIATSLAIEANRMFDRSEVLAAIMMEFETLAPALQENSRGILLAWKAMSPMLGQSVRISHAGSVTDGIAHDLAENGALLIRTTGGALETVLAGDVTIRTREK
jgi:BirA family transcriptional regulator, biotin operon repressor / biotin---[acetyl-CoA-carboxylase] ligase